jgi:outer membrane biosynthesis protein TonB
MKTLRLNPAAAGVLLLALIAAGCQHKKPVLVMPQQPPPTATPQATPTPAATEAKPAEQQPQEAQPTTTPAEQPQAAEKTAEKTKPKHGSHAAAKKHGDKSEVARNSPSKKVIPPEPVPTPQQTGEISPGPTPAGGNTQISTDQLLQGAEANLNGITRTLSKDEEAMRAQIREFIKQSRTATTENDPARAHTLAMKARLLSDELVKQR